MLSSSLALLVAAADPHVACAGTPAETLCRARMQAHDRGEFLRMRGLIAQEVEAVQGHLARRPRPLAIGALRPLCIPLEAGFNVCNERTHEQGCAAAYLREYEAVGCLEDPAQRARHENMLAMYWNRRMDHERALAHLQRGDRWGWAVWLAHWDQPVGVQALVSVVVGMALRAEIAASLRNTAALQESLAALDILRGYLTQPEFAAVVADCVNGLAWSLLLAREAELTAEDPGPLLDAALQTFLRVRPDRRKADNVRINLALAALHRGDAAGVASWAEQVDVGRLSDEGLMWLRLTQIRAALLAGDGGATEGWQSELDAIAERRSVAMAPWFAAWGRGLRAERLGPPGAAIAAFEAAEAELEAHAGRGARHPSLADRLLLSFADAARRLVQLYVASGDHEQAAWVARRARSRALRAAAGPGCAQAGAVAGDRPAAGELRLLYFRVSPRPDAAARTQWAGFAISRHETRVASIEVEAVPADLHRLGDVALQRWSDALLKPFTEEITAAAGVEVLATDALHAVPFHALPWADGSLIDHVPVWYGLDLAPCSDGSDDLAGPALVVNGADPRLLEEAEAVVAALRAGGRSTMHATPSGGPGIELLAGSHSLLHLAAHGARPVGSEALAADDRLLVADDLTLLTRQQILAAPRSPALVFLSACQASFTDGETLGGGVSLAHAFLLRGARYVVGPVDDLDGTIAQSFATRFYRALAEAPGDVPAAWRLAYRSTRAAIAPGRMAHLRMMRLHVR